MLLYLLLSYVPFTLSYLRPLSLPYLRPCLEYAKINDTNYNISCWRECEKLKLNINLLNCSEFYMYSENFINSCYNKQQCQYNINNINNVYLQLNYLMNKKSCKYNFRLPCNQLLDNPAGFAWACITVFTLSLTICTVFNCRRLWMYYYNIRAESRLQSLNTPLII